MASLRVLCVFLFSPVSFVASAIPSNVYISMLSSREKQVVLSAISQVNANASLLPKTTLHYVESTFTESNMMECAMNMSLNKISTLIMDTKPTEFHEALSSMLDTPLLSIFPFRETRHNISLSRVVLGVKTIPAMLELIAKYKWTNLVVLYDVRWRDHLPQFLSSLPMSGHYHTVDLILDQSGLINKTSEENLHFLRNDPAEVVVLFCDASYADRIIKQVFPLFAHNIRRTHRWLLADPIRSVNMIIDSSQIVIGFAPCVYNNAKTASLTAALSTTLANTRFTKFLVCDAVFALAHALHDMFVDNTWENWATGSTLVKFKNGPRLLEYFKKVKGYGTTGVLQFNGDGSRRNAVVDVMNLRNGTFVKIGEWSEMPKLTITSSPTKNQIVAQVVPLNQLKRKIKVVLVEDPPFVMSTVNEKTKMKELVGFSVDLIDSIADVLHFKYEFYLCPDDAYGGENPDGSFYGAIGEVVNGNADMSSLPLVINSDRLEYLDFSKPFMFYSMDMVMRKPEAKEFDITGFMTPYTTPVWVMAFITWLFVSAILTFVNYYSPYGHRLCDDEQNGDDFNWFNSLWFCLASMLQQGGDCTPRMFSGRVVVGFFWFCIIVWVSTYTANLAAVLTTSQGAVQVNNFEDVLEREYHIYVVRDTPFAHELANSGYRVYRLLWERISSENTFVDFTLEGFEKVRQLKDTVFVEESQFSDYLVHKEPCNVMSVKDITGSNSYGIAMPKHYPYNNQISIAILAMQENGKLHDLKRKWWSEKSACPAYKKPSAEEIKDNMRIHLENMIGVYVVLATGGFLAVVVIFIEFWWKKRRDKINAKVRRGWTVVKSTTQVLKLRKKPDAITVVKAFEVKPKSAEPPPSPWGVPIVRKSIPGNDEIDIGVTNSGCDDDASKTSPAPPPAPADSKQDSGIPLPGCPWTMTLNSTTPKEPPTPKQFLSCDVSDSRRKSTASVPQGKNSNHKNSARISYVEIVSGLDDSASEPRKDNPEKTIDEKSDNSQKSDKVLQKCPENKSNGDSPKDGPIDDVEKKSKKKMSKPKKNKSVKIDVQPSEQE